MHHPQSYRSLLCVQNLTVMAGEHCLLNNASFELNAGEVLAVLGANGAGKSTLLHHIIDDVSPYARSGEVMFAGQAIAAIPTRLRAQQMAMLKQAVRLQFPYTVEEVVHLGRTPHSSGKQQDDLFVNAILHKLAIIHLRHQQYTLLSGGEKQRVQLARILVQLSIASDSSDKPPRLLLLDEPCNGLDMQHQQQLLGLVREFAADDIAIILVAHDINWASQCADRFIALKHGSVIAEGKAGEVITNECLSEVYDMPLALIHHPSRQHGIVLL